MDAADIMTRNPVAVRADAGLAEAVQLMLEHHISGIPVADPNGKLVGIVTEGDLLRRVETTTERDRPHWIEFFMGPGRLAKDYVHTHSRRVDDVMTRDVISVTADAPLSEVVALMEQHQVKRVPVVADDVCIGIVSRADLVRALGQVLASADQAQPTDAEIRGRILDEVRNSPWGGRTGVTVSVVNGVVDLDGVIFDERERAAFRVAAENAPGVKVVHDHIAWSNRPAACQTCQCRKPLVCRTPSHSGQVVTATDPGEYPSSWSHVGPRRHPHADRHSRPATGNRPPGRSIVAAGTDWSGLAGRG